MIKMSNIFKNIINFLLMGKYLNMITLIIVCLIIFLYMIVFHLILKLKKNKRMCYKGFPKLTLKKDAISFISKDRHRVKIFGYEVVEAGDNLYLYNAQEIITITNVNKVERCEEYLYFQALGEVKIHLDLKDIYKYFSIIITSKRFDIEELKQQAIEDIINSNFNKNNSKVAKKYINIVKNVLNIKIFSKKIEVKQNKYHLPFKLVYKLNNKIHEINVE